MTNQDVKAGVFRKKPTYLELLNAIERDEDKIQLPERIGVQLWDSFAMGQFKEMVQQAQEGQNAQAQHQAMDQAMTNAANENEGVSRQELLGFMQQMNAANSSAQATLQQQMTDNIAATQRAAEAHATAIAQEISVQTRRQDQRDAVVDQLRTSLAEAHQTPASVPIPPAPSTQAVHTHYHQHHASLQAAIPQTTGSDPALLQMLAAGEARSDQRANAQESYMQTLGANLGNAIRHMQSQGSGLNDILRNLASRPRGSNDDIMAALAPSGNPPPPPPGAGAIVASSGSRRRNRSRSPPAVDNIPPPPPPFFKDFGTGYVAPVIQKKKKYTLLDRPRDDNIPTIAGSKRAKPEEGSNVLRKQKQDTQRRPPQPPGPRIPERYNIADDDDPAPSASKMGKMGIKIAARLAQHMANNKKRAVTGGASSTDPWEVLFGDGEDASEERVQKAQKFHKAVAKEATSNKVKKPQLKKKPRRAIALDQPGQRVNVM